MRDILETTWKDRDLLMRVNKKKVLRNEWRTEKTEFTGRIQINVNRIGDEGGLRTFTSKLISG